MAIRLGQRQPLTSGPHDGVFTTPDAFDAEPSRLYDARNCYVPDSDAKSGTYSRPGFTLLNNGDAIYTSATRFRGQVVYTHFNLDGTPFSFLAFGGHLFRIDPATQIATDVTPVGVTIDGSLTTRLYCASMGGVMSVHDGVNRPWVASNLSSTPITGTYIDFDGMGTAWIAFGQQGVFGGSGFWMLTSVNSVAARIDIAWTEPNDWTVGYQQSGFDDRWTLEQTGTTPLYGLSPSNVSLDYLRQRSIGSISGTVGPDLATTATHDAVSANVGTQASQTIVQFSNNTFFCDVVGRPWMYRHGSAPVPIWHQLRGIVDTSTVGFPGVTALVATGAFEPSLNLYCVAIWSPAPGSSASPTEWFVFNAIDGRYLGRWSIGPTATGVSVDCLGSFIDSQGRGQFIVLGSATSGGTTGYAWGMSALVGVPDTLVLEDLTTFLTDESTPPVEITTEGQTAVWEDDGEVPLIEVTTDRLGYSEDIVWLYDRATVLTGNQAPIRITVQTPNTSSTVEGTPTPNDSADGIYRTPCGLDLNGRGALVTVSPQTADSQWSFQRISVVGVPSKAGPEDK